MLSVLRQLPVSVERTGSPERLGCHIEPRGITGPLALVILSEITRVSGHLVYLIEGFVLTMMSIASSSESSESNASISTTERSPSSRRAPEPEFQFIPQGKTVDRALAIMLDRECMRRWGEVIYDQFYPGTRTTDSAEVARKKHTRLALFIAQNMAYETYCRFPSIPRFRRNVLLVPRRRGGEIEMTWIFVLRDNSSQEALQAPLVPEEVEAAMEFLGVEKKGVKWFDVRGRLNGTCRVLTIFRWSSTDFRQVTLTD